MVRLHRRAHGARRGKLTGDPAVQAAAVAINLGLNPLWYLGLSPSDHDLVTAAMNVAQTQRTEQQTDMADYQAARLGNRVAQMFAR